MEENVKKYRVIAKREIFASPQKGAYLTGDALSKLYAFVFIFGFIWLFMLMFNRCEKN